MLQSCVFGCCLVDKERAGCSRDVWRQALLRWIAGRSDAEWSRCRLRRASVGQPNVKMKRLMRRPAQRRLAVWVVDFWRMEECDDPTFHRVVLTIPNLMRWTSRFNDWLLVSSSGRFYVYKIALVLYPASLTLDSCDVELTDSCWCIFICLLYHS